MRMKRSVVWGLLLAGCGWVSQPTSQTTEFQLVGPDTAITMAAGETRSIQLLVVGASQAEVSLAPGHPSFATLTGKLLTLAPGRTVTGSFLVALEAVDGQRTATATVEVVVSRFNTAPSLGASHVLGDAHGGYTAFPGCREQCCPGPSCTIGAGAFIAVVVTDPDGDVVTVDAEVVEDGAPFTRVATHSLTGSVDTTDGTVCGCGTAHCGCFEVPLTGLVSGRTYRLAVTGHDQLGAQAISFSGRADWDDYGMFRFSP